MHSGTEWFEDLADVEVVAATYQFFTGRIPTAAGFEFLIDSPLNPADLNDPFYSQFNIENRYINFANNLGSFGEGRLAFAAEFGPLSFTDTIIEAYDEIIGFDEAEDAGINTDLAINFFLTAFDFYEAVALERVVPSGVPLDQAIKVVAIGSMLNEAIKAEVGHYAEAYENFVVELQDGEAVFNTDLLVTYGNTDFF